MIKQALAYFLRSHYSSPFRQDKDDLQPLTGSGKMDARGPTTDSVGHIDKNTGHWCIR